jgi:hypothetical protein
MEMPLTQPGDLPTDRLYRMWRRSRLRELEGRSAQEVVRELGPPSEVGTLDHAGHVWKQAIYRFAQPPSEASSEAREARAQGMELAPVLLFRDGICVGPERFDHEVLGGARTVGAPPHLVFRPGGSLP